MKNILKLLFAAILIPMLFNSCREDADKNWTKPDPSFLLYDTTLGTNVLYPTMEKNPFILTWEDIKADKYSVVVSATENFETKAELGTSTSNSFKTTIGALNTAILQLTNPYKEQKVYIRIESGTKVSNAIIINVTPYPADKPVIKNPLSGQTVTLSADTPTADALAIKWTDYNYAAGIDVNYKVEIALKDSNIYNVLGTTKNLKELALSNFNLNEAVLKLGAQIGVPTEVKVRVTAETTTVSPIIKTSDDVIFKIIPYKPAFVPMYIVGGFNDPYFWKEKTAPKLLQNSNLSEMYAYFQYGTDFRFLGQQDWNPLNFALNAPATNDSNKFFKTWSSNLEASGNENIKFIGDTGIYKITIDQNSRDIKLTPYNNNYMPSDLYLVGSVNNWDQQNALMMDMVDFGIFKYTGVQLKADSEFKFLGQQSWTGQEWGNIHGPGNSGLLGPNGDNNNIKFAGDGGLYDITVNLAFGTYTITKQ